MRKMIGILSLATAFLGMSGVIAGPDCGGGKSEVRKECGQASACCKKAMKAVAANPGSTATCCGKHFASHQNQGEKVAVSAFATEDEAKSFAGTGKVPEKKGQAAGGCGSCN